MSAPQLGRIVDHVERAHAALTDAFRNKTNVTAIQKAFTRQIQDLEKAIWDVLFSRMLTWEAGVQVSWIGGEGADTIVDATGDQLDLVGALVGEPRNNRDDTAYQSAIRLRLRVYRSKGRVADVQEVASLCVPGADVSYVETGPGIILSIRKFPAASEETVIRSLAGTKPAGVPCAIVYGTDEFIDDSEFAAEQGPGNAVMLWADAASGLTPASGAFTDAWNSSGGGYGMFFGKVAVV